MRKIYLIIGASSDLGCALIREIIQAEGMEKIIVIAHYHRSETELENICNEFPLLDMVKLKADLGNLKETQKLIDEIHGHNLIPTHIVSFSACAYQFNRLSELDLQRLNFDMTVQVYSFALICKEFLPIMAEKQYGKIVVMLSSAIIGTPPKNTTEYTTVKYALQGLIRGLASDYGNMGININSVSPGMVETKFIKGIGRKIREFTADQNPRHRNLRVDDVVPAILFLLSDKSEFMNGTNVNLSGMPG